ncbi:hypothetical protein A8B79_14225 [Balneola sp. EhC07]|jgi:hypothetical protein|uniref:hypothetical protein n=1 Tax=Balneola sp. EhC07 TaxID=1849360 RepID=UPI0007F46FBA|nr:hypothetical protein [Balneola sp. EhC07]OAN64145.1 hypothetical protein A8B79_14225 [Balneola sp. EhC07]
MKFSYLIGLILFITCSEGPTFERNNSNDPKSDSFEPDFTESFSENLRTVEFNVIRSDISSEKFEKTISIKWPEVEKSYSYSYKVSKIDMYGLEEFVGEFDKETTSIQDTILKPGFYTYKIKILLHDFGIESAHSFGELNFSHIIEGPKMHSDVHWWGVDVVQLDENRIMVTNPTIYSRFKSGVYDSETKAWQNIPNPPNGDNPRTHIISDDRAVRLDKNGYSFLDLETLTWFGYSNWSLDHYFYSAFFNTKSILITEYLGSKVYLFDTETKALRQTSSTSKIKKIETLIKVRNDIALAIGSDSETEKSYTIELYDLNTKNWKKLNDLSVGFYNPRAHRLNQNEVLIFERRGPNENPTKVLKYNFLNEKQEVVGSLEERQPILTRLPNLPVYSFSQNGNEVIIFISPTKPDAMIAYQIYNQELNTLSKPVHHFRYDPTTTLEFKATLTSQIGWGKLPNGDILLVSDNEQTAIFKLSYQ